MDGTIYVKPERIRQYVIDLFGYYHVSRPDAGMIADNLIDAEIRGVTTHGLTRIPLYTEKLISGLCDARAVPEIVRDYGATALIDAHDGLGQVAATKAMELAIEKAEQFGVGYVGLRNGSHYGTAGYYAMMAEKRGMIGFSMTNSGAFVAPFGGVNLEDISAPRCFEIERRLKERCDIPIFHDDQHGTAVITLAGLTNALKVVGKKKEDVRIVTSGAGAAAIAIVKLLLSAGFKNVTMCDRKGAIYKGRDGLNWIKEEMAEVTNLEHKAGSLADILVGADVFIGVSAPGTVTTEMVKTMNRDAIVFACANPTPEIFPEDAKAGGAKVVSTGRSDYPNQINNVLAFPGIFRGAFDVRAGDINEEMKVAAAHALAELISDEELSEDYIIPKAFDHRVGPAVAKAVAEAARKTGVAYAAAAHRTIL